MHLKETKFFRGREKTCWGKRKTGKIVEVGERHGCMIRRMHNVVDSFATPERRERENGIN